MATIDIRRSHTLGKELPFLLRAVKGTIENRVNEELNKLMA